MDFVTISAILLTFLVIFLTIILWESKTRITCRYKYNTYLNRQSFVIDEATGARLSHPTLDQQAPFPNLTTVCDIFGNGCGQSGDRPCFGTRPSTSVPYTWITYNEVMQKIQLTRIMLTELLVHDGDGTGKLKMVGIQSRNSPEWLTFAFAAAYEGYATVPLYETFGETACCHILSETEVCILLCTTIAQANRLLLSRPPSTLRHIVVCENADLSTMLTPNATNICVHSYAELLSKAASINTEVLPRPVLTPESLYMVCYTSGSTGVPKGVLIKHKEFATAIKNVCLRLEDDTMTDNAVHMCYLPLAHILEQMATLATLLFGGQIGFLTGDITTFLSDVADLKPTHLFTVPRVLGRVHNSVMRRLSSVPLLPVDRLFNYAVHQRCQQQARGHYYLNGIWELLFFRRVRSALGGRVRVIVCGGAPMSAQLLNFTRAAFSCPVLVAYGLTESCGMVSIAYFGDCTSRETVGALIPGVMVKLVDVPDMEIQVPSQGIGEVCVKSPACSEGYLHNRELTTSVIDADGWLHSGDLGTWSTTGALQLLGRCKTTFKLSQGEFVSPDRVEEVYQLCDLVFQVYVEGNPLYSFPVAVVVPNVDQLIKVASEALRQSNNKRQANNDSVQSVVGDGNGDVTGDLLYSSTLAKRVLLRALHRIGKSHGLQGFEQVKAVHLTPTAFTVDNKLLTANLKLARFNLRKHFAATINDLYTDTMSGVELD